MQELFTVAVSFNGTFDWDHFLRKSISPFLAQKETANLSQQLSLSLECGTAASGFHFATFSMKNPMERAPSENVPKSTRDFLFFNGYLWNRSEVTDAEHEDVRRETLQERLAAISNDGSMESRRPTFRTDPIQLSSLLNSLETDGVVETMRKVDGPWALVLYMLKENSLWFGRDCFGRKSLLLYDSTAQESSSEERGQVLVISSLHPLGLLGVSVEVPVGTLHCLKLSDMTYSIFQLFSIAPLNAGSCLAGIRSNETTVYDGSDALFSVNRTLVNSDEEMKLQKRDERDILTGFVQANQTEIEELIVRLSRSISCQLNVLPYDVLVGAKSPETTATVSVLFSGGIDSLLVAALLGIVVPAGTTIDLLNVAFAPDESHGSYSSVPDRQTGINGYMALKKRCSRVHWNLLLIDVTRKELYDPEIQTRIRSLIKPACTVRDESIGCAIWFAANGKGIRYDDVSPTDGKDEARSSARILFLGSGADELFGGYMRHRSCFAKGGYSALAATLEEELLRLGHRSSSLTDRITSDHSLLVHLPYLHESFVRGIGDKLILRAALWLLGYEESCFSPKRAIQFGSRIAKVSGSKGKGEHRAFT